MACEEYRALRLSAVGKAEDNAFDVIRLGFGAEKNLEDRKSTGCNDDTM